MSDRVNTALMGVAVLCALLTTGLVVRRELGSASTTNPEQGRRIRDWKTFSPAPTTAQVAEAPVTIVEFFDFQCPACRRLSYSFDSLLPRLADRVRIVRRHFPLRQIHPRAFELAVGGVCSAKLDSFPAYYHRVFALQPRINQESDVLDRPDDAQLAVESLFAEHVNDDEIARCLRDPETARIVEADMAAGSRLGVRATPTLLINDRLYSGAWSTAQLDSLISRASARRSR